MMNRLTVALMMSILVGCANSHDSGPSQGDGVDIANLLMEGILDKTGQIPLNGEELCFESATCAENQ